LFEPDFAHRLLQLESAWLKPRMFKLGQAPNLLLSSLAEAECADVDLRLTQNSDWHGPLRAALAQLPFPDQCFGTVVLQHVLEWSGSELALVRECVRVIEPGGRLLLLGINPYAWSRWYRLRKGFSQRARLRGCGHWRRELQREGLECAAPHFLPWPESRVEAQLPQRMQSVFIITASKQSGQIRPVGKLERLDVPMAYTGYVARVRAEGSHDAS